MDAALIIDRRFTNSVNEAMALFDADKLKDCIAFAHELLADREIPLYHRMKVLIILASTVGNWYEAEGYLMDAESIWKIHRHWHPEGEHEWLDESMAEIRFELDALTEILEKEWSEIYGSEERDGGIVSDDSDREEEVADAQAMMEDMDLDTLERMTESEEQSEEVCYSLPISGSTIYSCWLQMPDIQQSTWTVN